MPTVEVKLSKEHDEWLKKNKFNLSQLVYAYLKEFIPSIEKTKQGIMIPVMFMKAPDDTELKKKLKKNPKFKHLVKEE